MKIATVLPYTAISALLCFGLSTPVFAATFSQEYVSINAVNTAISAPNVSILHASIGPGNQLSGNLREIAASIEFKGVTQESRTVLDIANVWPATWTSARLSIDSNTNSAAFNSLVLDNIDTAFSDAYVVVTAGGGATRVGAYLDGVSLLGLEGNAYQPVNAIHIGGLNLSSGLLTASASFDWCCNDSWRPGTMSVYFISSAAATTSPVPLPAAAWLLGSGLLGLIGVARRKAA